MPMNHCYFNHFSLQAWKKLALVMIGVADLIDCMPQACMHAIGRVGTGIMAVQRSIQFECGHVNVGM